MKAILHVDNEWGIGKSNGLMFSIPADMKFFRETTTDKVVVMGSNTQEDFIHCPAVWGRNSIFIQFSEFRNHL